MAAKPKPESRTAAPAPKPKGKKRKRKGVAGRRAERKAIRSDSRQASKTKRREGRIDNKNAKEDVKGRRSERRAANRESGGGLGNLLKDVGGAVGGLLGAGGGPGDPGAPAETFSSPLDAEAPGATEGSGGLPLPLIIGGVAAVVVVGLVLTKG